MAIQWCAAVMDWLLFLAMFVVLYGAGERGFSTTQCAALGGALQATYMVTSLTVGFLLPARKARVAVLTSIVCMPLIGILAMAAPSFWLMFLGVAGMGVAGAVFFNAFQTLMRTQAPVGSLLRTVGFYTVAWSSGAGMGFLTSGAFYRLGVGMLAGLCLLAAAFMFVIVKRHQETPEAHAREASSQPSEEGAGRPVNPGYVWIGWLTVLTVVFVQRPLQTFVPSMGAREGVSPFMTGLPLFVHMGVQGFVGLGLARCRWILYRRTPMMVMNLAAVAVFLGIWLRPAFAVTFVGISLLGIYAGFAFLTAVYYASNSGRRSFNIGVSEFLVGFGSLAGLFACETWMRRSGHDVDMYLFCGLALLVSTAVQWAMATYGGGRRQKATS